MGRSFFLLMHVWLKRTDKEECMSFFKVFPVYE